MKKNTVIPIVAILSGVIACLGVFVAGFIIDHRVPNFSRTKVLYVYPETTAAQVADSLSDIVIRSRSLSRAFANVAASPISRAAIIAPAIWKSPFPP